MKKVFLWLGVAVSFLAMAAVIYVEKKEADENGRRFEKFKKYYQVLNKWVANDNKKVNNEMILNKMGFHNIAIYGNGEICSRLVESLENTSVHVDCIIEKKANNIQMNNDNGIKVVGINNVSAYSNADVIVVTPMFDYDTIVTELLEAGSDVKIMSVEDLVFGEI